MNRRMEMQKGESPFCAAYTAHSQQEFSLILLSNSLNPKIRRSSKPFLFALPNQHSADLILILRNILMHIQRFLNIEIHVFAVLISYDTVAFSLTEKFYRLRTHDGSVNSVLTGRRAPRCMWPRIVALVSMPVAASILFAMEEEWPMPSALMMM